MLRVILRSVSVIVGCSLVSLGFLACDVEQPGDELARDLDEEDDEGEGEAPARPLSPGSDELTNTPDPAAAANYFVPVGNHDVANCSTISGWVKDGDTTAATWATVHRDAPWPYGDEVAVLDANLYRSDLPFTDKYHGFSMSTPASLKTGDWVTIYIHGINVDVNGDWDVTANSPLINQTARSICCNPNGTTCNTSGSGSATLGPQTSY